MRLAPSASVDSYKADFSDALNKINWDEIQRAVDFLRTRAYGTIFTVGNGGSASTAEHMAADLNKWSNDDAGKKIRAICLNSNMPEISALTNDVGWANVYREQLMLHARRGDVLIAYSVHGGKGSEKAGQWSQNITGALYYMREVKGKTIGITGCDGGAFKDICDYCVIVPSTSTPIVEGLHGVIHHILVDAIRMPPQRRVR